MLCGVRVCGSAVLCGMRVCGSAVPSPVRFPGAVEARAPQERHSGPRPSGSPPVAPQTRRRGLTVESVDHLEAKLEALAQQLRADLVPEDRMEVLGAHLQGLAAQVQAMRHSLAAPPPEQEPPAAAAAAPRYPAAWAAGSAVAALRASPCAPGAAPSRRRDPPAPGPAPGAAQTAPPDPRPAHSPRLGGGPGARTTHDPPPNRTDAPRHEPRPPSPRGPGPATPGPEVTEAEAPGHEHPMARTMGPGGAETDAPAPHSDAPISTAADHGPCQALTAGSSPAPAPRDADALPSPSPRPLSSAPRGPPAAPEPDILSSPPPPLDADAADTLATSAALVAQYGADVARAAWAQLPRHCAQAHACYAAGQPGPPLACAYAAALTAFARAHATDDRAAEELGALLERIAHRHVALAVRREHYAALHECLLRALKEVLGPELAVPRCIDAWDLGLRHLCWRLAEREQQLRDAQDIATVLPFAGS